MSIDFRIRNFLYPVRIWSQRRAFERNQWMSPEELQSQQLERLRGMLTHAGAHVPYYRETFESLGFDPQRLQSPDDMQKLPLLNRDVLRREFRRLTAENASDFDPVAVRTSGTSGRSLEFLLDRDSQVLEFVYYWRHWSWAGYRLGDRFAELSSHYFLAREKFANFPFRYQPHTRRLLLNSNLLEPKAVQAMAAALRRRRPRFLKGLASALYVLATMLRASNADDIRFDAVFSTGEMMTSAHREVIQKVFRARVLDSYGHMERTVAISQCPKGGLHVNPDYGFVELLPANPGDDGRPLARIVGTSLYNRAMPLIRYESGDLVEPAPDAEACSCGRRFPLVRAIHGRQQDVLRTPDGRMVTSLFLLPELVEHLELAQFLQTGPDALEIRAIASSGWTDSDAQRMETLTRSMVGPEMTIALRMVSPSELHVDPSGKCRVVVNLT